MEDIFIKNMKGVKPLKKEQSKTKKIKTKKQTTNKKIIKNSFFLEKASNKKQNVSELDLTFSDLNKDLKKGHILKASDLLAKRPSTGISPNNIDEIIGLTLNVDKNNDEVLMPEDIVEDASFKRIMPDILNKGNAI